MHSGHTAHSWGSLSQLFLRESCEIKLRTNGSFYCSLLREALGNLTRVSSRRSELAVSGMWGETPDDALMWCVWAHTPLISSAVCDRDDLGSVVVSQGYGGWRMCAVQTHVWEITETCERKQSSSCPWERNRYGSVFQPQDKNSEFI